MNRTPSRQSKIRYPLIDAVRGVCIAGMIIYHTLFDVVELFGFDLNRFLNFTPLTFIRDVGAGLFIFVSGLCFHFSKHRLRRFAVLFVGGVLVGVVTYIAAPDSAVIFGILTFMSVSGLLLWGLDGVLRHLPPKTFCLLNLFLFAFFLRVNYAYVGTYSHVLFYMPITLYRNYITAFFGFPFDGFVSGDYFPVFPWFFACLAGFFFYYAVRGSERAKRIACVRVPVFPVLGKYSLVVYIVHQPVIYGAVWLASRLFG